MARPARRRPRRAVARAPRARGGARADRRAPHRRRAGGRGGPQTAQEVADALGLHHTSVRVQLAALEGAGVVEGLTDPPSGRGRPVRRYVLAPDPGDREAVGHRELVRLLMGLVRQTGLGPEEMERFGERQGWAVPAAGRRHRRAAARVRAPRLRAARGPGPGPADLVLGRCPFADGVEAPGGELICLLHRGLARGIAARAAPEVAVTDLVIEDPRRAGCRLRLAARARLSPRPCPR